MYYRQSLTFDLIVQLELRKTPHINCEHEIVLFTLLLYGFKFNFYLVF